MTPQPHHLALRSALAAERSGHEALLAGRSDEATAAYRDAARAYLESWRRAPPESYGRLIGFVKASILAGDEPISAGRTALRELKLAGVSIHGERDASERLSPAAAYALALAALAAGEDRTATAAAKVMREGGEAFGRTARAIAALASGDADHYREALAAIVRDFEQRDHHLTGVAIADTALVLRRLAARRGVRDQLVSALLPEPATGETGGEDSPQLP